MKSRIFTRSNLCLVLAIEFFGDAGRWYREHSYGWTAIAAFNAMMFFFLWYSTED